MNHSIATPILCWAVLLGSTTAGQDWPTYLHDNSRSGVTEAQAELPLAPAWTFTPLLPPAPAWGEPAKQDFYHSHFQLRATDAYDQAFHAIAVGGTIYFGSSSQDKVYAIDANDGSIRWTFLTEGPVRFAPVFSEGRVYAGSDDGCVYCLSARDGTLVWKARVAPDRRMIPGNGRIISLWPVRTGLVVDAGTVFCTAGLFPEQGTYLAAFDARTGSPRYRQRVGISPQGYVLASRERLYVPTGRTNPAIFSREKGTAEGEIASAGGAYALLIEDVLVTGPGRGPKELQAGDVQTKDTIATFGGLRMVVAGTMAYMQSERQLAAFNRGRYLELSRPHAQLKRDRAAVQKSLDKMKKNLPEAEEARRQIADMNAQIRRLEVQMKDCDLWTVDCRHPHALILAGGVLFAGGENEVAAIDCEKGTVVWTGMVKGRAVGLCVANGALYVSTDAGGIHCFRNAAPATSRTIAEETHPNPYPRDELTQRYEDAARTILRRAPAPSGYCLVLDCGEGRLAYELARQSQFKVIGVDSNAIAAERTRRRFDAAGLGGRAVVQHVPAGQLPYTSYFANIVTSEGVLRGRSYPDPAAAYRMVRPCGGILSLATPAGADSQQRMRAWGQGISPQWHVSNEQNLAWGVLTRGPIEGAGQWTHIYGEPGNTACSGDKAVKGPLTVQWFGEPGPREMIDRHHRNIPPLVKDGRLFVPGDCVVFAVDAYNGVPLWRTDVPDSRRLGAFLDCGSMAVDDHVLYVAAGDRCLSYDAATGKPRTVFTMPPSADTQRRKWGCVIREGSILLGSACKSGAGYVETSYDADVALWDRNMKLVTSDYLFAKGKDKDTLLWTYRSGLVLNTTITVASGRVYFVETQSPRALADKTGRMPVKTLFAGGDQYLVALEQATGRPVFKRKLDTSHFEEPVYLNFGQGVLLLSGSRMVDKSVRYYYDAFHAETGNELWHADHDTGLPIDGQHGEYNRHPTIVGEAVYAWPYAYVLRTGARVASWKFDRRGHGCGGVTASAQCLFWRGGNPWMYELGPQGGARRLNSVSRPGCWLNMIPAGGMLLIPEASSGCTCGFPLQTSLAYIPQDSLEQSM